MFKNRSGLKKNQVTKGSPNIRNGENGDLSLNITSEGIGLFGKVSDKWYRFGSAQAVGINGRVDIGNRLFKHDLSLRNVDALEINTPKITSRTDFTLDITGDITLDADGGDVTIKDGGNTFTSFKAGTIGSGNASLTIFENAGGTDFFKINCTEHGVSTISTKDFDAAAANLTLDIDGDIELNADGGQVTIKDDTASHFLFDCDNTLFRIYDDANALDFFQIQIAAEGATTISTLDADTTAADLHLDADGVIKIDAASVGSSVESIQFIMDGNVAANFAHHHNSTYFTLYENGGATDDDHFTIFTHEEGVTEMSTTDANDHAANLNIIADGHLTFGTSQNDATTTIKLESAGAKFSEFVGGIGYAKSLLRLYEAGGASQNDYFQLQCTEHGVTTLTTVDAAAAAAHLQFMPDGDLVLDPGSQKTIIGATDELYFDGGTHTKIAQASADSLHTTVGGELLFVVEEDATTSAAQSSKTVSMCPHLLKDIGGVADTPAAGFGALYVNSNVLYHKAASGTVTNLLAGGGGTQTWSKTVGGYKTNNNSASNYYTQYYSNFYNWTRSDSSPTSVTIYTAQAPVWIADKDGTLTNIRVIARAFDTGLTDPLKFYVYKGATADGSSSTSCTLIGTSSTITPVANDSMVISDDFSSSNDFDEGDSLFVWLKKDSTSGNQDLYFTVTISGEYD